MNKVKRKFVYNGDENTIELILNKYQEMAKEEKDYINARWDDLVVLEYGEYNCALDIYWYEKIDDCNENFYKLVINLFCMDEGGNVIGVSEDLKLIDICRKNYIENRMKEFLLEAIN